MTVDETVQPADFTCADIMQLPQLKGIRLLAGAQGLKNSITRINVMEVPDITDWVKAGEFLMTTGYPFREEPEKLARMIPVLSRKGVAALGVKTKRFMNEIPPEALKMADECGFPVFELPPHTVFSDVQRETMEQVLVQEARMLTILHSRVQTMSRLVLEGSPLDELIASLERMLSRPVVLFAGGRMSGSERAAAIAAAAGVQPYPYWADVKAAGEAFVGGQRIAVRRTRVGGRGGQTVEAELLTAEWPAPHTQLDALTLDRMSDLIGMELATIRMREEVEYKYLDQFLQDWLLGRIASESDVRMRAEASGYPLVSGIRYAVVLARPLGDKAAAVRQKPGLAAVRTACRTYAEESGQPAMSAALIRDELLFVVPEQAEEKALKRIADMLERLLPREEERRFSLCVGSWAESPELLHESYKQAVKVEAICRLTGTDLPSVRMADLGVYRLLHLLADHPDTAIFRSQYVEPLLEYDRKHNASLLLTVTAYLEHNQNTRKTAEALFTHYNTVVHRLERVKELLGLDLNLASDRLQLELAIRLHAMLA